MVPAVEDDFTLRAWLPIFSGQRGLHDPPDLRFFFTGPATTEIYTLSLHDALPIFRGRPGRHRPPDQRLDRPRARAGPAHRRAHGGPPGTARARSQPPESTRSGSRRRPRRAGPEIGRAHV